MSCRKQQYLIWTMPMLVLTSWKPGYGAEISRIGFKGTQNPNVIEIVTNEPVTYERQDNTQDKQIVLELKGARIAKQWARKIDTSSFKSKVSLISPYQVQGQQDTVRIVIQMREAGDAEVSQDGNVIKVSVPAASGVPSGSATASIASGADAAPPVPILDGAPVENPAIDVAATKPLVSPNGGSQQATGSTPSAPAIRDRLDEFAASRVTKRFTGKPITLNVRDVEAADVFRLIAEASGFNIIVGDDVIGKVTLSLVDVPWDQALDVVLHTLRLGAERTNNILRIVTLKNLTAEKQEELKAIQAAEASAPRITRVFPIRYASLNDLQGIVSKFIAPSATNQAATQAVVLTDNRTNSLVVQDIPQNIERVKKLVELLDTQTPQVMIEAKIIEASEAFSKTLSGGLGVGSVTTNNQLIAAAGADPTAGLVSTGSGGSSFVSATSASGSRSGFAGMSLLTGSLRMNAILSIGESENQVKVIAAPRTVVLNKEKATIVQGQPVLVNGGVIQTQSGPQLIRSIQTANLSLDVKPTVTNEGSVLLDLTVSRDTIVQFGGDNGGAPAPRNMKTQVLVENGSTLVMGGVYVVTSNTRSSGIPYLRKIPIIGALFGDEGESNEHSELFFFITPRILNPKEAGIGENG